jgi:hypothetical protein
MGILSWPKRTKPGKPQKQASPVDRALEYARENDLDLLGLIEGGDPETFIAFAAVGRVPTHKLPDEADIPEQVARTFAIELAGRKPARTIASYDTGMQAYEAYQGGVKPSERAGLKAALMMAEARYLLGAFPALVDARSLLPLIDIAALENPYWHDGAFGAERRRQLLSLALCISQRKYAELQAHPSMAGLDLYTDGILALSQRMFDIEDLIPKQ